MPLITLLVDDEPLAREGLRALLAQDLEIGPIYDARDGHEALAAIRKLKPDIVFLDVQMPEMDGISVIKHLDPQEIPAVVFVTAHDQYAIDAFEINAIDYLLKPVTRERFAKAIARAKSRLLSRQSQDANTQILSLLHGLAEPRQFLKRVAVRSSGKTSFVSLEDVRWMAAAEDYVHLNIAGKAHLLRVSLTTLEKSLDPQRFLRIHRSIIVNLHAIKDLQPAQHGEFIVTLADGVRLRSGRTHHDKIRALIDNPF